MSINRIFAVLYKDFMWASNNPKLLAIVLLPPIMSVFFQFAGKGALLGFSLMFSFSMIGCFLASYLITEEKKIESLKNILITPLTAFELCIGKFLFPLILCILFAAITLAIANKIQLFFVPSIFLALVLMGACVSLLGVFLGLVVKNEQELGIIGPLFIYLLMGGMFGKKSPGLQSGGYFPEFHLVHLIDNYPFLTPTQVMLHLFALAALLVLILIVTNTYIRFFFSSDLDSSRFNVKTLIALIPLFAFFGVSGQTAKYFAFSSNAATENLLSFTLARSSASVEVSYDNRIWSATPMQVGDAAVLELKEPIENNVVRVVVRDLKDDERTLEQRQKKTKTDGLFYLIDNQPVADLTHFLQSVHTTLVEYKTAYDFQCDKALIKFSFAHPKNPSSYEKLNQQVLDLIRKSKTECKPQSP